MAERIKGLQIDLSMRDMGVSKTLSGIKREFRSLNSSLKLSSNNFKYGEKSASSYKTRMNDLDKSIKVGTSNLNELEKQYNQVAQSQGANSAKAVRLQTEYNKQANAINAMQDEYGRLNQYYRENFSMAGRLSNSFKSIGSSMQSVGGQAQNMGRSLTSSITKPALIAGTAMAGITAKLGFDRLVGLDSAKAKLEGLGYSTKEVGSITDQVSKAIEGGMTTMAEGTDVAAGALAAGVKEGKDLEKYIKLVGDAAVGSNRPVGEMAMIFNRVQGQGKLMTEELNMVEEGMPGFSNAMAKHLGVSYDAFREMVTNGEVSSKEFLTVMDDFAGGMANAYSKSWKGMMQNTKAYIGMIGESLLGGVFEQSKDSLHEFEKMLKSPGAQQWAKETGEKLGSAFSKLANGIKGIINWWQSLDGSTQKTLGGMVKWLGITLVTMGPVLTIFGKMASTIGGMFSGMSSLIQFFIRHNGAAKVSAASQAIWNGVTATARGIANGYRAAMTALTTSQTIQAIKSRIAATAMTIWTGVTKAAALATRGLGLAIRFMTGPVGIVITVIAALTGAIVYLWKTNSTFRNAVISIWKSIKAAAISIFGFIKPYIINIWNAIKNSTIAIWNAIKTSAVTIWNGIKFAVQHPIQALKNVLSALWNGMKTAAIKIWTLLKNGVLAIIKAYVAQVRSNFNLVKRIVLTIFNAIKSFSIKVWNAIKNGILNIVRILRNGIANIFKGIKNTVTTIFNAVKNFSIKVWNTIKNSVINRAKGLWNGVRNTFNTLKNGTIAIFNAVKNFALKVWTSIKNAVVSRAKALWSGVRNTWNNLKKGTTNLFNSVGSFMSSKWNSIKSGTVNKAKALWSGIKDAWGSLSKGTRNTMNAVGSFMSKKWKDIKSGTVDIVTGMKDKITGVMNKMGDVIKSVTGDIKGFFSGMIDKVKGGLNKLIDGVNWVGGKLGMDKLPKIKLHTGTEHTNTTTNVVKNGKIARDTFATVGDKGRGNGPGGFRNEAIKYPNGKMALTPNRDTTAFLPKGSSVMNGAQTHSMLSGMPKFANGTLSKKKPKKNKKGDNVFGDAWDSTKAGAAKVVDGGKAVVSKSLEAAAKGKDWLKDKVGDVMDWIEKPGKLLNKVLEGFGVNMDAFGIAKAASLPRDMMSGMFGKLKKAATDTFKKWMEEQGAGDGGYIDLSKGINFGFANSAAEAAKAGYPFPRAHHGLDINYGYGSKLYSTLAGTATAKSGYNGGFGNSMWIKSGAMEAIYGHMSKLAFSGSKKVKPGTYLGLSGGDPSRQGASAGDSTGPHLHYEMRKNGVAFDPTSWLKKNNGGGKAGGKYGSTIKQALGMAGLPQTSQYIKAWQEQARTESTFNPKAQNPSGASGLVQVKPATFGQYKLPGHGNIWNPLDNLIAGMRYAKARYGTKGMLSQIGHGLPYATGGLINSSGFYQLAEEGHPEFVIPTDPSRQSDAMKLLAIARQRIESNKKNKRPNQMRTPSTSNTNDNEMMNVMARQLEATQRQVELLTQLVASNQRLEQKPTGVSEQDMSKAQGKRAQMMAYNMGGAF
ncbi:tape measure protein [Staphylococcus saprophyticus]|uniref:tape measure protein n=1 Tax=Staphylococcus saprophyticus TaxID=29385 RepID=UPI00076AE532|nr:tape measure protein [Staphylococcus saprophyticus]AMG20082.1 phage tail tape measure protein [Staphylococcus saprophyticus]MDW3828469.1 tape measure protein [Staphylococcus saprophyticus]MDW4048416.1 tape measure protein [Staphylococcus saprophyticus]MDW4157462.1 tape measure protein [Staphylococcus saprophyticus]